MVLFFQLSPGIVLLNAITRFCEVKELMDSGLNYVIRELHTSTRTRLAKFKKCNFAIEQK